MAEIAAGVSTGRACGAVIDGIDRDGDRGAGLGRRGLRQAGTKATVTACGSGGGPTTFNDQATSTARIA